MPRAFIKTVLLVTALFAAASATAQTRHRIEREPKKETERPPPPAPVDKRDSVVAAPSAFAGRPYWLALAQCGGIYFRLNELYTGLAVQVRVVKPDPKLNTEYTRKLNEAIRSATVFFEGAERSLMNERGIERTDAVLIYEGQAHAAGDHFKSVDSALAATRACPALYAACQKAYPKACIEPLEPLS